MQLSICLIMIICGDKLYIYNFRGGIELRIWQAILQYREKKGELN